MYYGELFDLWFPVNKSPKNFDRDGNKKTFNVGGYYRHDFSQKDISLIALNSIHFKEDNECQQTGPTMLDWLETNLEANA